MFIDKSKYINIPFEKIDNMIFGLCRSGHHAYMHWSIKDIDKPVYHLNNILWDEKKTFGFFKYENAKFICKIDEIELNENCFAVATSEGKYIDKIYETIDLWKSENNVLILRDPFNTIASWIKKFYKPYRYSDRSVVVQVNKWIDNAKLFAGLINNRYNITLINYSKWVNDNKWPYIHPIGGGSSFDGINVNANEIDFFNRWQYMKDKILFHKYVMRNQELIELSKEIFPSITAKVLNEFPRR